MKFLIITPSFNQLDFLKRCIASVADQIGGYGKRYDLGFKPDAGLKPETEKLKHRFDEPISVHHHVQDGGSKDGTVEWLSRYEAAARGQATEDGRPNAHCPVPFAHSFSYSSERDHGMYDAINKGMENSLWLEDGSLKAEHPERKTTTDKRQADNDSIVAWLNCDEQYLSGTLEFVGEYFERHPEIDILFGDYLMVDENGELLAFRKGCTPRLWYIQASHLNNLSCAMFFRSGVFQTMEGFDTRYKAVADEDFVVRALMAGFKAKHVRRYFSVFTFTGSNLGGGAEGQREFAALKEKTPWLPKLLRVPLNLSRWIEKVLGGTYFQRFPLSYSIYVRDTNARNEFASLRAGWKWPTAG